MKSLGETVFAVILVLGFCGGVAVASEPPCPSGCTPVCAPIYFAVANTEVVTVSDPTMGLVGTTIWSQCSPSNCCGSASCTLSVSQHTVAVGVWSRDNTLISLASNMPDGFGLASSGLVTRDGSTTAVVPAQTAATCTLGKCQTTNLKAGPGYTSMVKHQQFSKICLRQQNGSCSLFGAELCDLLQFDATATAKYLTPDVLVSGACGIPWAGCSSCVDPAHPACS